VLVTGSAGRLGRAVVRELTYRGIAATGLARAEDLARAKAQDLARAEAQDLARAEAQAEGRAEDLAGHMEGAGDPTGAGGSGPEADGFRVLAGDARDPSAVARGLRDVDAVIHLAAIPTPTRDPGRTVFGDNTLATFTVLDEAVRSGVRRATVASSWSVTGLPFAPFPLEPAYVPVDEQIPLQVADAYALSKQVDEATAEMVWRRHGLPVVALRLPYLGYPDAGLASRVAELTDDPAAGARDMWSYLDYRDAARVCVDAVTVDFTGFAVVGLAAPETLCPYPTEALLGRFLPHVPRRASFPGRAVPVDVTRAREVLGFAPVHPYPVAELDL
jgi:nucleoside-diphosphate-sugar epimerase